MDPRPQMVCRRICGGSAWMLDNRYILRAVSDLPGATCASERIGTLRWQDRNTGDWKEYKRQGAGDLQFRLTRYGDRNDVTVNFVYDNENRLDEVRDHFGTTILKYVY